MFDDWRDSISAKYRSVLHSIEDDHGREFSRFLMGAALTQIAKRTLKRCAPPHHHDEIDKAFMVALLSPNHPYHAIKQHALDLSVPHLEAADSYVGAPTRRLAALVEQAFVEFEADAENAFRRIRW